MNSKDIEYLISRIDSVTAHITYNQNDMANEELWAIQASLRAYLDNPDLPLSFINDALEATEEMNAGETEIKP